MSEVVDEFVEQEQDPTELIVDEIGSIEDPDEDAEPTQEPEPDLDEPNGGVIAWLQQRLS